MAAIKGKFSLSDKILEKHGTGYVPDKRFNRNWKKQGLDCPFEHCIETMPLREKRRKDSCPLYGHDCPGGKGRVEKCVSEGNC